MKPNDSSMEEQIRRALTLYCRGVDRCDPDIISSAFAPNAQVDYGIFTGSAAEFTEFIIPMLRGHYQSTSHCIHNCLIDVTDDGACASVETYAVVHTTRPGPDRTRWFEQLGCRYADRLQRRDDHWKISRRVVVLDWNVSFPAPLEYSAGTSDAPFVLGRRDREDFTYSPAFRTGSAMTERGIPG